jgi:ParB/RepB/Spo0J family partition protein
MNKRRQDDQQAQAIRERLAQRKAATPPPQPAPAEPAAEAPDATEREAQARSHFLGSQLDTLVSDRAIESTPLTQIAPELRPGLRQPRMVPLPGQLVVSGETPAEYAELVAELRELGESLRERQVQPIVIYPGSSQAFPEARYLILVGQRRWTAAHLVGMKTIDAIVVEPPSPLDRIALQFAENEAREDFSDIERAWTLQQLREAMGGERVGVAEVAARLNLKRSRAYQLLRMLAFPPEQQQTIALLRLQERQLLPLIDAYHQEQVTPEHTGTVLQRLQQIAAERALSSRQMADQETTRSVEAPRRSGIDAATVARLVARVTEGGGRRKVEGGDPRWYSALLGDVESVARKLRRASDRLDELGPDEVAELRGRLQELRHQAQQLAGQLGEGREE